MLTGPPGIGKTMLAQRLPGLLPPLSESEALEVTAIHSVAGTLSPDTPLITRPPFIAPHHTSSVAALVGGGSGMARPGAVSRAHRGVLFLDECAEIGVSAMEALRTPLEDGEIRLARRDGWPAIRPAFSWCWRRTHVRVRRPTRGTARAAAVKRRYLGKLSGPLLDRVDLRVEMHPVRAGAFSATDGESTSVVRAGWRPRGKRPLSAGAARFRTNAEVPGVAAPRVPPQPPAMAPLRTALDRGLLRSVASTGRCGSPGAWPTWRARVARPRRGREGAGSASRGDPMSRAGDDAERSDEEERHQ